ncbi:hypothetical protein JCM30471_17040 [Desulfuromonas carbonis]
MTLNPALKYWIFLAGIVAAIFTVILGSFTVSWYSLDNAEKALVQELAGKLLPFPFLGAILLVVIIGTLISLLFSYYIIPILQLAEQARLITTVNLSYRIPPEGAREIRYLSSVLNDSADAFQRLQQEVDGRIAAAQAALQEEHNRLAALMSELPSGVLVCNSAGQILLYNQQAQNLLQRKSGMGNLAGAWIGLGRSIFGALERGPIAAGLEAHQLAAREGHQLPATTFPTTLPDGTALRVKLAPVFHPGAARTKLDSFVLTLEELDRNRAADDLAAPPPVLPASSPAPALQANVEARPVFYEFDLFRQPPGEEVGQQSLRDVTYVVFDTETTGLDPSAGDEVIQLGAIRVVKGRLLLDETIDQLIDPQRSVPASSVAIHGIAPELLIGQPTIEEILPLFKTFAEGAVLVAHNAAFDMRFLNLHQTRTGIVFRQPVLDTLLLSSIVHPTLGSHSLDAIAERFDIPIVGRHTALGDAIVTAEVLLKLIPLLEAIGIRTLEEALAAEARSPYARIQT